MANNHDVVVIGAGHNALVTAYYLARAGMKPLVLERAPQVGGCAVTEEFAPGFRCSALSHSAGPLHAQVWNDLQLNKRGVQMIESDPRLFAPLPDGRALFLFADPAKSAAEITRFSRHDAEKYPEFHGALTRISAVVSQLLSSPPPEIDEPSATDLLGLLKTGRGIRSLGKKDLYRLIRWAPMAVADLVAEWFEYEPLRAVVAAPGIFASALGPWSAGSALGLLLHHAGSKAATGTAEQLSGSMKAAGVEIRTGAEVASVAVKGGHATGVVLSGGEEISARAVVSAADPKRTFLRMIDAAHLTPDFLRKVRNYRSNGTVAKVHLALDALPDIPTRDKQGRPARIHIGPEIDYLERAFDASKYGEFSAPPYLDVSFPSLHEASWAPQSKHVMSVHVQYAPYKLRSGDWHSRRNELADTVMKALAAHMPDLAGKVLHRHVITPLDLEETYGLTGGHLRHGELSLDQLFAMRPVLGSARHATPVSGLYLCGAGTHPASFSGQCGSNAAREVLKGLRK